MHIQVVGDRDEPAAAEPQDYPEGYLLQPGGCFEEVKIEEQYSESVQADERHQEEDVQRQATQSDDEADEEWYVCMYVCMYV
jgi:hypothetical protein